MIQGFSTSLTSIRGRSVPVIHLNDADSAEQALSWLRQDRSRRVLLEIGSMSPRDRHHILDVLYTAGLDVVRPSRFTFEAPPTTRIVREVPHLVRFGLWPGPALLGLAVLGRIPRKYLVYGGDRLIPPPSRGGDPAGDRSPIGGPDGPPPLEAAVDPDESA